MRSGLRKYAYWVPGPVFSGGVTEMVNRRCAGVSNSSASATMIGSEIASNVDSVRATLRFHSPSGMTPLPFSIELTISPVYWLPSSISSIRKLLSD